jgi:hypothetical protein
MLTMDNGIITYRERALPGPLRSFIALLGFSVGLGIPAAWLANVNAQTSWPTLALVALVVVACTALGMLFVLLALVSAIELQIDPTAATVLRIRRGPLLNDTTKIPRGTFGTPVVIMRDSEDGPFPILQLPMAGRKRIEMACFDNRSEAEAWRKAIAVALTP